MSLPPSIAAWQWDGAAFLPCDSLPIADRGFRYGMALFESVRILHSVPLFLEEHLQRLREACGQREFALDERALQALGPHFRQQRQDGLARLYVTGGDGNVST